uniref:Uncharacterized protein n=1 Tax=Timema douglasi TaxID=61478 RepID=A0A7R8VS31_TIMDO|nr:unnamed protein product [Timema douglasi]
MKRPPTPWARVLMTVAIISIAITPQVFSSQDQDLFNATSPTSTSSHSSNQTVPILQTTKDKHRSLKDNGPYGVFPRLVGASSGAGTTKSSKGDEILVSNSSSKQTNSIVDVISTVYRLCYTNGTLKCVKDNVLESINSVLSRDSYEVLNGVTIQKVKSRTSKMLRSEEHAQEVGDFMSNIRALSKSHVLSIDLKKLLGSFEMQKRSFSTGRKWFGFAQPEVAGKSSFLAGFGVGFVAFALKKLLLPFFIGAQIVKSVLIAMFLPSILGGLGKIVGKGVSTFASTSGASGSSGTNNVDDFEFKDNMGIDSDPAAAESSYSGTYTYPEPAFSGVTYGAGAVNQNSLQTGTLPAASLYMPGMAGGSSSAMSSRFPQNQAVASPKVSYATPLNTHHYGSYYTKFNTPKQDYKVFHNIPTSSLLLTNYDPFYSPLLSRLDSVFKQLGYETEACRERLVCSMYRNPAKFAPFSNLVSAQLSRNLVSAQLSRINMDVDCKRDKGRRGHGNEVCEEYVSYHEEKQD